MVARAARGDRPRLQGCDLRRLGFAGKEGAVASAWRRVMVYLGLVDDDEYDEYEPYDEPAPLAAPPPPPPRRPAVAYVEPEGATAGARTLPREPEATISVPPQPQAR